jgi:hypothetical protein
MATRTIIKSTMQRTDTNWRAAGLGLTALLSVVIALFASFGLHEWAEVSTLHHGIQHVLLFTGGVGVGSVIAVAFTGKRS